MMLSACAGYILIESSRALCIEKRVGADRVLNPSHQPSPLFDGPKVPKAPDQTDQSLTLHISRESGIEGSWD